jgi:hypothetical protein
MLGNILYKMLPAGSLPTRNAFLLYLRRVRIGADGNCYATINILALI